MNPLRKILNINNLRRNIWIYWLTIAGLSISYIYITSLRNYVSFDELLSTSISFNLSFLLNCLLIMQAGLFMSLKEVPNSKEGFMKYVIGLTFLQQVLSLNFPGIFLVGYLYKHSKESLGKVNKSIQYFSIIAVSIIFILTLGIALINVSLAIS